jgi:Signal peptidase, peptidase S26
MPGSGRCARCGASLALATAAVNVHPPRAGRLSRLTPSLWRLWHGIGRMSEKASPALAVFGSRVQGNSFDLSTLLRCIVPGWPQYYRGDRPRALVYLFIYSILLLPGLVLAGTWLGSLLLGLAVAMHIVAVCDGLVTTFATPGDRIAFTMATGLVLCFAVYLPAGWLISRVATPIRINATIPPFEQGQVLWYNRSAAPERGSLVVYTLPTVRAAGRLPGGGAVNYVFQGDWIGRVIAMPGQTVSCDNGHWLVNGVLSKWQLTNGPSLNDSRSWHVPDGHVFVYPDGLVPAGTNLDTDILQQIYVIPTTRIAGELYFRSLPLSQMSTIH